MLPRKNVTPAAVTIASSDQAGARISPEGAQQLQPESATHEPPPCAPKPASHHPLPKPAPHHQAESTNAAQRRHHNKPSRSPKCSTEALAVGQFKPPPSRSIQTDLTAVRSRRSSTREPRRPEDRRAPTRTRRTSKTGPGVPGPAAQPPEHRRRPEELPLLHRPPRDAAKRHHLHPGPPPRHTTASSRSSARTAQHRRSTMASRGKPLPRPTAAHKLGIWPWRTQDPSPAEPPRPRGQPAKPRRHARAERPPRAATHAPELRRDSTPAEAPPPREIPPPKQPPDHTFGAEGATATVARAGGSGGREGAMWRSHLRWLGFAPLGHRTWATRGLVNAASQNN
jgi:hypothetical protein